MLPQVRFRVHSMHEDEDDKGLALHDFTHRFQRMALQANSPLFIASKVVPGTRGAAHLASG